MTAADTTRDAVERRIDELLGWLTGPDSGQNDGIVETVALLRALLAERDAALAERNAECDARTLTEATLSLAEADLIAARAEVARLREALEFYADQLCEHGGDLCGRLDTEACSGCLARAALEGRADG